LGVVFNHAMQVQGYITGEVAFKMKGTPQATNGFLVSLYPGLARLTGPNVYVVRARTPAEFVAVTKRLQARADVEWVEPIVTYDGKEFGERTYNTTSSAWGGVFAKMTPQQVDAIASKVFGELVTATSK
jgi:hypothetical protein